MAFRSIASLVVTACLGIVPVAAAVSYDELSNELVAPCCWQEALAHHRSPAAEQARAELRALIDEGRSEAEIRGWFVEKYGERILITPAGEKAQLLFWAPALAALVAFAAAAAAIRKWTLARARRQEKPFTEIELDESQWDW